MLVFANRASNVLYDYLVSNFTNDPYLLPATICPCIPDTFIKAKCQFEFVDIDVSHAMSRSLCIEKLKQRKYAGILFVHAYGHKFDNSIFYKEIKLQQPNLNIIDDKCLLTPSFIEHDKYADLTLYSTGYSKIVELGFGGWGLVSDERFYSRSLPPMNYLDINIDEYQETVINKIQNAKEHRHYINSIYHTELNHIPYIRIWDNYCDWRFMISVPANMRESILKSIFKYGYFAGTNYPSQSWNYKQQASPVAELEAFGVINLFNDFRADEEFAYGVCRAIKDVIL